MLSLEYTNLVNTLQSISPMPDDDVLNLWPDDQVSPLETYDQVMTRIEQEVQSDYPFDLIPYLLAVLGIGEANGGFRRILHLIEAYPHLQEVYPLIQDATHSSNAGTRKWCCLLLGRRRNQEDEPFLVARLQDTVSEVRQTALVGVVMLSQCYEMKHLLPLVEPLRYDEDEEVADTAVDAVEALSGLTREE